MITPPHHCRKFVGRRSELDVIGEQARAAAQGNGTILLISGEAGIGKTRLVTEVYGRAAEFGLAGAIGHGFEYGASPFWPWLEVVRSLAGDDPAIRPLLLKSFEPAHLLLADVQAPAIAPVPIAWQPTDASTESAKFARLEGLAETFRFLARRKPLLIILEDLQWADQSSLDFLLHVQATVGTGTRMMVVATYRSDALQRGHPLRAVLSKLQRGSGAWRIDLLPFDDADVKTIVFYALDGKRLSAESINAVTARAEGNPLFAEELIKCELERAMRVSADLELPTTIAEAIRERFDVLSAEDRAMLTCAAAVGRRFRLDVVTQITERPQHEVTSALKRALDLQLVVAPSDDPQQFAFRHSLTKDVVYAELIGAEARALHRKIAQTLEAGLVSALPTVAELAHHWSEACDPEKAAYYNERAGDEMVALFAYNEAAAHYRRALDFTAEKNPAQQARLNFKLGGALNTAGSCQRSREAYEAALDHYQSTGDAERAARTCLALALVCWSTGDLRAAKELVRKATVLVGERAENSVYFTAHVAAARYAIYFDADAQAAAHHLALADNFHGERDIHDTIDYLEIKAYRLATLGEYEEAFSGTAAVADLALSHNYKRAAARCWGNLSDLLVSAGKRDLALAAMTKGTEALSAKGFGSLLDAWVSLQYAWALALYGEFDRARKHLKAVLRVNLDLPRIRAALAHVGVFVGLVLEDEELASRCEASDLVEYAFEHVELVSNVTTSAAEYLAAFDRLKAAQSMLHRAVAALSPPPPTEECWRLCVLVAQIGEPEDIEPARELLRAVGRSASADLAAAYTELFEAFAAQRVGNVPACNSSARSAVHRFHYLGWPYFEAVALELAGECDAAFELFTSISATRDVRRLSEARAKAAGRSKILSPREHEVAKYIIVGASNRAIAKALSISERTVESHVSAILAKIGVASRIELVRHASELSEL